MLPTDEELEEQGIEIPEGSDEEELFKAGFRD